jgi:hypothetical protein
MPKTVPASFNIRKATILTEEAGEDREDADAASVEDNKPLKAKKRKAAGVTLFAKKVIC